MSALITRLWRSQPGNYFFLSTKSRSGKWADHCFKRSQIGTIGDFIEDNRDKDIYWCPSGFKDKRRITPFVMEPNLLWADLDDADPREITPKPTIAIESSPGRYVGVWVVDKPMTGDINRRLTYAVGADKSGWDLAQVLRIPGTTNYKYESLPKVRTLWIDGPNYRLRDIERKLPELAAVDSTDKSLASEVFKKHEKGLPQWLRRELIDGKPTIKSDRSQMIWKLQNTLIEAGLTREECFLLIEASPWNKFKDRPEQLRRELDKIINKKMASAKGVETYQFLSRSMEEVEAEELNWIWYPYLARGELSILEGDPGLGKSYLAQMVCGALVDGKKLPSVRAGSAVRGKVAVFDLENSAATVTKKRLVENGIKNLRDFYQEEEAFHIDQEEKLLHVFDAIERQKPDLVVFDTLNTYIGKADIHKSSESQQAMAVFREIAKRYNCSVLVLRHLTKGTKTSALYRGQGSIAFAGLARVVMTVGTMPDDPDVRVMAVTKLNVTQRPKALCFTIERLPDTLKAQDRSRFVWGDFVDLSSDEILATPERTADRGQAAEFLKDILSDGPVPMHKIEKMAETRSLAMRTVHRAADELGVVKKMSGFGKEKKSTWALGKEKARASE